MNYLRDWRCAMRCSKAINFGAALVGVACFAPLTHALAQRVSEGFSYKSLPLGTSLKTFKASNKEFLCINEKTSWAFCASEKTRYGGSIAKQVHADFVEGGLVKVAVDFDFPDEENRKPFVMAKIRYDELKMALADAYGSPNGDHDLKQNIGQDATTMTTRWKRNGQSLSLSMIQVQENGKYRAGTFVSIEFDDYAQRTERARKAQVKRGI